MANNNVGLFIPTTQVWDVADLMSVDVNSPEFKELLVRLYRNINAIALALNAKDTGVYTTLEYPNSQTWYQNPALTSATPTMPTLRNVYRKVINFGALPNAATKSVPHDIPVTVGFTFTRIYATASDTTGFNYIPIPYASSTANNNIELNLDAVNVNITTGINRTNFNVCYVILEYIKQ